MYFQLKKLVIWPVNTEHPPRLVPFELGKVNVITGSSRSGKSAIIPIIDYCLASSDCNIPIDTIRDNSAWYGIVVQLNGEQLLLTRKAPTGNKPSNEFFLLRDKIIVVPNQIVEPNEKYSSIKILLNNLSGVPALALTAKDEDVPFHARLGFRDLVALNFQNQDIVANQNIMFYKTHAFEHRKRLSEWFPYILGAVDIEILSARQQMSDLLKKRNRLEREIEKIHSISNSWVKNLFGHLKIAEEYGLIEEPLDEDADTLALINIAKEIAENPPDFPNTSVEDLESAASDSIAFDRGLDDLSIRIAEISKRLQDIKRLQSGIYEFGGATRSKADRLQLSRWFANIAKVDQTCPACGSSEHENAENELTKISEAFAKQESRLQELRTIPTSLDREELGLKEMLSTLLDQKSALQRRYDQYLKRNKEARAQFQRQKSIFVFLGNLQSTLKTLESISDDGELRKDLEKILAEQKILNEKIDEKAIQARLSAAKRKISQDMLKYLNTLDVEDKYRRTAPDFDVSELSVKVQSSTGDWHFLAEVGSASNWVAFHLSLMCALQDHFLNQIQSPVASFVIFDQPSQVYFPRVPKGEEEDDKRKYIDEDIEAVQRMFKTISSSVLQSGGNWQAIVLDHADDTVYGDVSGVNEVEVWREGNKLIPEEWYQ